jgi:ubiquinone/menaquinone biosynthesis C-methylase UbiE
MEPKDIYAHWQDWAVRYGSELRATTLASSIKRLEIHALRRAIERAIPADSPAQILEVGCGNGQNIVALAKILHRQGLAWTGIDYVPEMVEAATKNAAEAAVGAEVRFLVGDVLQLDLSKNIEPGYQVVFTDRLLINLETIDKQTRAIGLLARRVAKGGSLVLIENSRQTKDRQNDLREAVGLSRRSDAPFNLFFNDEVTLPYLRTLFEHVEVEDFGGLHDILLYVLLPHAMKSEFHYDHPLVQSVAELCSRMPIDCGPFGQNRLYYCERPRSGR